MCGPIAASRMSYIAAEMARARGVAQGAPAAAPRIVAKTDVLGSPTTARAVRIDTPIGTLTFYVRERAQVRSDAAQRLRNVIDGLADRRRQTVPQMLASLSA